MDQVALKEWAVAVRAIEDGRQDVILRKGGIQEHTGDFQLEHREFLLYPAREHQKPQYLKPEFVDLLSQTQDQQVGHLVDIRSSARAVRYHLVTKLEQAAEFADRHIWTDDFIQMRLDYKPDRPLYIIELEVEMLEQPLQFVETAEYSGCRSWVTLHL